MCGNSRRRLRTAETGLDARAQLGRLVHRPRGPCCAGSHGSLLGAAPAPAQPLDLKIVTMLSRLGAIAVGWRETPRDCFASLCRFDPGGRADPKTAPHSLKVITVNVSATAPLSHHTRSRTAATRSADAGIRSQHRQRPSQSQPATLGALQHPTSQLEEVLMRTTRIKSRWLAVPLLICCGLTGPGLASAKADTDPLVQQYVASQGNSICSTLAESPTTGAVRGSVDGAQIASSFTHYQAVEIIQLSVQGYCPQYMPLLKQAGY